MIYTISYTDSVAISAETPTPTPAVTPPPPIPTAIPVPTASALRDSEWLCECGAVNASKFCPECGSAKPDDQVMALPEVTPEVAEQGEKTELVAESNAEEVKAYLVITVADVMYEPIPLYQDGKYTITQGDMVNVIAVTEDSVAMYSSTCDDQDCVLQGTVSLANRNDRVLQNAIFCFPNAVLLELCTPEEVIQLLLSMASYAGEGSIE